MALNTSDNKPINKIINKQKRAAQHRSTAQLYRGDYSFSLILTILVDPRMLCYSLFFFNTNNYCSSVT